MTSTAELARSTDLGVMPSGRRMSTTDKGQTSATVNAAFDIVRDVEGWPRHLPHYRWVRMIERDANGGGIVEMSANRPFGPVNWPTWWRSLMEVDHARPALVVGAGDHVHQQEPGDRQGLGHAPRRA